MTDSNSTVEPSVNTETVAPAENTTAVENTTEVTTEVSHAEKPTFTRKQLAQIVSKQKQEAAESVRKEYEQKLSSLKAEATNGQETAKNIAKEEALKTYQQMLAYSIQTKLNADTEAALNKGREKYDDFDSQVDALNLDNPGSIGLKQFVMETPNAADVFYELGKNPIKYAQLMAVGSNEKVIRKMLKQFSDSITSNEKAAAKTKVPSPINQNSSSTVNIGGGESTISDLRKSSLARC